MCMFTDDVRVCCPRNSVTSYSLKTNNKCKAYSYFLKRSSRDDKNLLTFFLSPVEENKFIESKLSVWYEFWKFEDEVTIPNVVNHARDIGTHTHTHILNANLTATNSLKATTTNSVVSSKTSRYCAISNFIATSK